MTTFCRRHDNQVVGKPRIPRVVRRAGVKRLGDLHRAVLRVGLMGIEKHTLSDRDIEVYVTDPTPLLTNDSWWDHLGDVLVVERLANPGWHPSRLVYYVGGKLDLTVIKADALPTMRYERPFTAKVQGMQDYMPLQNHGRCLAPARELGRLCE